MAHKTKEKMKTIEKSKRIVKIIIDGKHKKSFPLFMYDYLNLIPEEKILLMSRGKRLTHHDHEIASPFVYDKMLNNYLLEIESNEAYVFDVIKNIKPTGVRKINSKYSEGYFEIYFDNNISVKCPEHIFRFSPNKMPSLNRNY